MSTLPLPEPPPPDIHVPAGSIGAPGMAWSRIRVEEAMRAAQRDAIEAAAKEFDRRDGGTGLGFYDPHEPAEIIRALLP